MRIFLAAIGALLIIAVFFDALWTTMGIGGGPLSKRLIHYLHQAWLGLYRRFFRRRLFLTWGSVVILLTLFMLWVGTLWLGWTLIFNGSLSAVRNSSTGLPATVAERVYFTGYTIFTLGTGDYVAEPGVWQVLMALASLSGLFLVTLTITYLLPIIQAASDMRQLAMLISALGPTPQCILLHTWNGRDCEALGSWLSDISSSLATLEQRYLTYPALHYFQSLRRSEALSLAIAALDDALTIVDLAMPKRCSVAPAQYRPARQVITEFLATLHQAFIDPAAEAPPPPDLAALRDYGLPLLDNQQFHERIQRLDERRRLLAALVERQGWHWDMNTTQNLQYDPETPLQDVWRSTDVEVTGRGVDSHGTPW